MMPSMHLMSTTGMRAGRRTLSQFLFVSCILSYCIPTAEAFSVGLWQVPGCRLTSSSEQRQASHIGRTTKLRASAEDTAESSGTACTFTVSPRTKGRRGILLAGAMIALGNPFHDAMAADLDEEASNKRILAGYATLLDLYDNWEKYAGKGEEANGDNVRRQIGTVGNKSPLFGIRKVLLKRGLDLDLFEEFDRFLVKIDSDSYSAIFADSSTSPKRGYAYMADAKVATKKAIKSYKAILEFLEIKP